MPFCSRNKVRVSETSVKQIHTEDNIRFLSGKLAVLYGAKLSPHLEFTGRFITKLLNTLNIQVR